MGHVIAPHAAVSTAFDEESPLAPGVRPATAEDLMQWPETVAKAKAREPWIVPKFADCEVRLEDGVVVIHVANPLRCRILQEADNYALIQGLVDHAIRFEEG
jgi:hypothetical protein